MNKRPAESQAFVQDDAAAIAQSLRDDFVALIAVFDRQRVNAQLDEARSNISVARAAAERGLQLSEQLVELLRTPS